MSTCWGYSRGREGSVLEQRAEACCQQQDRFLEGNMASPLPPHTTRDAPQGPTDKQSRNEGQITSDLSMGLS